MLPSCKFVFLLTEPAKALRDNNTMVGIGISPEGIETNVVLYDLMLEMGWRNEEAVLEDWIKDYIERRYGGENSDVLTAWKSLVSSVYNDSKGAGKHCRAVPVMKPSFHLQPDIWYDPEGVLKAWDSMVAAAPHFINTPTFR